MFKNKIKTKKILELPNHLIGVGYNNALNNMNINGTSSSTVKEFEKFIKDL